MQESRVVFVKDYWRPDGSDKEGDICRILVEHKVPHIATFETGNDVVGNVTIMDQLRRISSSVQSTMALLLLLVTPVRRHLGIQLNLTPFLSNSRRSGFADQPHACSDLEAT